MERARRRERERRGPEAGLRRLLRRGGPRRRRRAHHGVEHGVLARLLHHANDKCVADCAPPTTAYPGADVWCGDLETGDACWGPAPNGGCVGACYPTENAGNNFLGLRKIAGGVDLLYAKYENGTQTAANLTFRSPTARELFDTAADPWCTVNTYASADGGARAALDAELDAWFRCAGAACP